MTLTLQQSFNNVKIVCDGVTAPGLDNDQRQSVNESLNNIAGALQAHELMLQAAKETDKKVETPEDESNETIA